MPASDGDWSAVCPPIRRVPCVVGSEKLPFFDSGVVSLGQCKQDEEEDDRIYRRKDCLPSGASSNYTV